LAVRYLPHLMNMLPFITDQILMHFYANDLFLGTQIEKLNKLFYGKMDYSGYGTSMRYKLKDGVIIKKDGLEKMYTTIEGINADSNRDRMEIPAVVFYTNIKETKCPVCKAKKLEKGMKAIKCEMCEWHEKGEKKKGKMFYLFSLEEDIFKLSKCPICNEKKIKERNDFQDFIECENCGIKMRKWSEENWDPMLAYGNKFKIKIDGKVDEKYFKFKDLVGKHKNTLRERFPERPSELDVKNLFYVWVSDFVVSDENANENNGNKTKNKWIDYIKMEIGAIWTGKNESDERKIEEFMERFVDLDEIH